jgi:hypothetical protein
MSLFSNICATAVMLHKQLISFEALSALKVKFSFLFMTIQWYLGIRPLWNKSNLVYVLFGREKFCLVYDLCLEYDSHARTCMNQNES